MGTENGLAEADGSELGSPRPAEDAHGVVVSYGEWYEKLDSPASFRELDDVC